MATRQRGIAEEQMYDMYRRLALAKYEERYGIPSAYVNQGHQLEETATECVLSFEGDRECTSRVHSARPAADRCSATFAAGVVAQSDREHPGRRSSAVPVQQVDPGRVLGDGGPPAYFQVRVMICLTLFALWPSTQLVHAFTALIGYLFWPYVVYRSRDVAAKDGLVGLCRAAGGSDARFIPRLVPQPTWVAGGG